MPQCTQIQTKLSLHLSVTYHYSHHAAPAPLLSVRTFHSSWCVNCLQGREQRWQTLWPVPWWQQSTGHTAFIVCRLDQSENTLRHYLNFGHTAGCVESDTGVKRQHCQENSGATFTPCPLSLSHIATGMVCPTFFQGSGSLMVIV